MSSPPPEPDPEDRSAPIDDLDRALRELIEHEHGASSSGGVLNDLELPEDLTLLAGWEVQQHKPPAVLCIRAVDFREPLVGRRARFWLTSFDESRDLIALGWRDGLRLVSEEQDPRGQLDRVVEPTVSVQEEADYYRALSGAKNTMRFAAGLSASGSSSTSANPASATTWAPTKRSRRAATPGSPTSSTTQAHPA